MLERLAPDVRDVRAEAYFAAASEMARRVEDVLCRRTQVALRTADQGATIAESTAALMAQPLGWDESTARRRADEYCEDAGEFWRREPPARRKA
jgi:glycerol-3-phosphate dehydrogenase